MLKIAAVAPMPRATVTPPPPSIPASSRAIERRAVRPAADAPTTASIAIHRIVPRSRLRSRTCAAPWPELLLRSSPVRGSGPLQAGCARQSQTKSRCLCAVGTYLLSLVPQRSYRVDIRGATPWNEARRQHCAEQRRRGDAKCRRIPSADAVEQRGQIAAQSQRAQDAERPTENSAPAPHAQSSPHCPLRAPMARHKCRSQLRKPPCRHRSTPYTPTAARIAAINAKLSDQRRVEAARTEGIVQPLFQRLHVEQKVFIRVHIGRHLLAMRKISGARGRRPCAAADPSSRTKR